MLRVPRESCSWMAKHTEGEAMSQPLKKRTAAEKYVERNVAFRASLRAAPVPEFKTWKPDAATLRAWDRAENPYRREPGDGR
jgi:hypothetical protein